MASSSGNAPLRPLLPRSKELPPFRPPLPPTGPLAKKRKAVSVACDICRKRKIRCDANRPKCSACTSGNQECTYTIDPEDTRLNLLKRRNVELETQFRQLQSSHHDLERLVQALKHLDDNAASAVIQQLRQGANITELARDVDIGSLLVQLSHRPTLINQDNGAEPRDSVASSSEQANKQPKAPTQDQSSAVNSPYEELFDLLRTASNQEALETIRRIRQGHNIHTILLKAKEADPVAQLSLVPETRRKYLFPYRSSFPHFLKISDNPYLHSNIYKVAFQDTLSPQRISLQARDQQSIANQPLYTTPFNAVKMVDPYLWNIKASRWTSVTDDDQLVSQLLNSYFLHQYTALLVFHKDYFLEDLAKGRTRFCSPLLVNAILALACHASTSIPHRAKFWSPQNLAYQFLAEARRLWEIEDGKSSLTTLQAAMILSLIYNVDTLDKIGRSYSLQAVAIAHDLKLFQFPPADGKSKKAQRARAFTAWCIFAWDSMTSFHYRHSPLFAQKPEFPLPSVQEDPSWYPEIYVRYPLDSIVVPIGFGFFMNEMVKLHEITYDLARHYWGGLNGSLGDPSILRHRLDSWFCDLPEPLSSNNIILPMHLRLHLEYQCILVAVIQAQSSTPISPSETTSNLSKRDTDEIRCSYVHIETLIRLYYVHHNLEAFDPFLIILLFMLGSHAIEILKEPATPEDDVELYRSTLILCARSLHAQGKNVYVSTMLYLMLSNSMEAHDNVLLKTYIHDDVGYDQDSIAQYNRSDYPVPIIKINEDHGMALLKDLVKAYEALSLDGDTASTQDSTYESP